MKTITEAVEVEIEIKKSKFIAVLLPFSQKEEKEKKLDQIKKRYPRANHYCYAYRTMIEEGSSDDGEPSKTAGVPMLEIIKKQDFYFILIVVIRYFGGIKLGTGGLVRAYQKSLKEALSKAKVADLSLGVEIHIKVPYASLKQVLLLLSEALITGQIHLEEVTLTVEMTQEVFSARESLLLPYLLDKKEIWIKKETN